MVIAARAESKLKNKDKVKHKRAYFRLEYKNKYPHPEKYF